MTDLEQVVATGKWLLPTWFELLLYSTIAAITATVSSIKLEEQFPYLNIGFDIKQPVLDYINAILENILGTEIAATLATGVFWGLVGVLVYIIFWLISNFSAEVTNDLAIRKYVHPEGTDPNYSIKALVERSFFRLVCVIVLVFYLNTVTQVFYPWWTEAYAGLAKDWTNGMAIRAAVLMLLLQIFSLHAIAVLSRLTLLRKRVFGGF